MHDEERRRAEMWFGGIKKKKNGAMIRRVLQGTVLGGAARKWG